MIREISTPVVDILTQRVDAIYMTTTQKFRSALAAEDIIVDDATFAMLSEMAAEMIDCGETPADAIRSIIDGILDGEIEL